MSGSVPIEGPPAVELAELWRQDKVAVIEYVPEPDPAEARRQRDRISHRLRDAARLAGIPVRIRGVIDEEGHALVAMPVTELAPVAGTTSDEG